MNGASRGPWPAGSAAVRYRLEVRLSAADVGNRVVIRWRRPAGDSEQIADVLGVLTAADDASFTVRKANGQAFDAFSREVFADGALPAKTKQLIAVAVAHVTQCPYCIRGHTKLARRAGASDQEIMEAIWVAAEMRAGGAFAHATVALHALSEDQPQ